MSQTPNQRGRKFSQRIAEQRCVACGTKLSDKYRHSVVAAFDSAIYPIRCQRCAEKRHLAGDTRYESYFVV